MIYLQLLVNEHNVHRWRVYARQLLPALRTAIVSPVPRVTTLCAAPCARPVPAASATSSVTCRVVCANLCVDETETAAAVRSVTTSCVLLGAAATTPALRTRLASTASVLVSNHSLL